MSDETDVQPAPCLAVRVGRARYRGNPPKETRIMATQDNGPFQLPPLPWDPAALEPVISARTIGLHYGKHHKTYVTELNELVAGTPLAGMSLEQIIRETAEKADQKKIFNNAAQTWNHTFFWNCLRAPARAQPSGA